MTQMGGRRRGSQTLNEKREREREHGREERHNAVQSSSDLLKVPLPEMEKILVVGHLRDQYYRLPH